MEKEFLKLCKDRSIIRDPAWAGRFGSSEQRHACAARIDWRDDRISKIASGNRPALRRLWMSLLGSLSAGCEKTFWPPAIRRCPGLYDAIQFRRRCARPRPPTSMADR